MCLLKKIEVIPNGVDLSIYSKLPKKGEFKKKYGVAEYEKIILYLGRIHKSKGINMLVESFLSIKNRLNNVKLVIVGPDDGFLDVLIKQIHYSDIAGDVIFTGPLHGLNKIEAYVDADLFVTPSFSGFPLTFLESCICGTPIITTNKIEELDWINGNVGFVVGYSSDQISEIILKILDDDGLLSKLSINSVCFVKENFGWDKISESVERLYYEVL
jgi:Glycosyltransferase